MKKAYKRSAAKAFMPSEIRDVKKRKTSHVVQDGKTRTAGLYGRYGIPKSSMSNKPEKKYHGTVHARAVLLSQTNCGASSAATLLHIAQGTSGFTRIGRTIQLKSIHLRIRMERPTQIPYDTLRIIVYLDQQCNGTIVNLSDLLSGGSDGINPDPTSYINLTNSKRFKILRDEIFCDNCETVLRYDNTNFHIQEEHFFDWHINLDIPIEYSGNTGDISEIKSNNVGVMFLCANKDQRSSAAMTCRVRYTDN